MSSSFLLHPEGARGSRQLKSHPPQVLYGNFKGNMPWGGSSPRTLGNCDSRGDRPASRVREWIQTNTSAWQVGVALPTCGYVGHGVSRTQASLVLWFIQLSRSAQPGVKKRNKPTGVHDPGRTPLPLLCGQPRGNHKSFLHPRPHPGTGSTRSVTRTEEKDHSPGPPQGTQ